MDPPSLWAEKLWREEGFWKRLVWAPLVPLSFAYAGGARLRNLSYGVRLVQPKTLPRPVISVGNLTVGGTGKTPTVLWLAGELAKRGHRVAILSRGYKRALRDHVILGPDLEDLGFHGQAQNLMAAGDEPVMMAKMFGHRVGVGEKRYEVGMRLLEEGEVDVFLLDDGFQHRELRRELDVLLLGDDCRGWVLPAGPFREPRRGLLRAHICLITGARGNWEAYLGRLGKAPRVCFAALRPKSLVALEGNRQKEISLALLARSKIFTVCGIANPAGFYRMIHEWDGEIVSTMEFPDHHRYSVRDWQRINREARSAELIVTTEKDILKLACFPFTREKLVALRVEMMVENSGPLIQVIEEVIRAKIRA